MCKLSAKDDEVNSTDKKEPWALHQDNRKNTSRASQISARPPLPSQAQMYRNAHLFQNLSKKSPWMPHVPPNTVRLPARHSEAMVQGDPGTAHTHGQSLVVSSGCWFCRHTE